VFEARYLDMISHCLKADSAFGVILIRDGDETGEVTMHSVGTLARITDWYQGSDGLLGVTAVGEQRFRLVRSERQPDGLNVGDIELIDDQESVPLPEEFQRLSHILAGVLGDLGKLYESLGLHYDDAVWVGYRFAEVLPIDAAQKQWCLESDDPIQRLRLVSKVLSTVSGNAKESGN
jgi:Lon protease-like protein